MSHRLCDGTWIFRHDQHHHDRISMWIIHNCRDTFVELCESCAEDLGWRCGQPKCGWHERAHNKPIYAYGERWCAEHSGDIEMIINDEDRDKIVEQAILAFRDILAGVDDATRRRMVAAIVGRINAHARGDVEAADQYRRVTFLDLATVQRISEAVAIRRALRIVGIVASVAATQLPAVAGAIVGAVAAFIGEDVTDDS